MDQLQATVLRSLLAKDTWDAFSDVIKEDTFTNSAACAIYKHLAELHAAIPNDLGPDHLSLDIEASYSSSSTRREELLALSEVIRDAPLIATEGIQRYVRKFIQREAAYRAALYITTRADSEGFDVNHAANLLQSAVDVGPVIDARVTSYADATLPGEDDERIRVVGLGVSRKLDDILHGGVGAGELLVFLAPPARGKTSYLWKVATSVAQQGLNVLGVTLEISAAKCVRRIDQALTGLTRDELITAPKLVRARRRELPGEIWIKDFSYTGVTVDDLRAQVVRMQQRGQKVDALMVDYLELVRPTVHNRNSERHNYARVTEDMRALAVELEIPVITAWQVNRSGSNSYMVTERDISECWDVIKISDIILGLNQSAQECEEKIMRINVIKQRESTSRPQIYVNSDLDRMIIRDVGSEEVYDEVPDGMDAGA